MCIMSRFELEKRSRGTLEDLKNQTLALGDDKRSRLMKKRALTRPRPSSCCLVLFSGVVALRRKNTLELLQAPRERNLAPPFAFNCGNIPAQCKQTCGRLHAALVAIVAFVFVVAVAIRQRVVNYFKLTSSDRGLLTEDVCHAVLG